MREALLQNEELVSLIRRYTMTGDRTADAYAALMPKLGFRPLVDMLDLACDKGIEAVENAPDELKAFIAEMEVLPEWLDRELVEQGARQELLHYVHLAPLALRGGLLATFINKYSALPMALTGTLGGKQSARRSFETASFFGSTIMPGALERYGAGFKASAKVRLMHSMVRLNLMRGNRWDAKVYGIPIPQVDQMPAGMFGMYLMSLAVLDEGREEFTPQERARVELSRYRCYLLGLPETLLAETPRSIRDIWLTRQATLRSEWDDATCGELLRATMNAELFDQTEIGTRIHRWYEAGFSRLFLIKNFLNGSFRRAQSLGVDVTRTHRIAALIGFAFANGRTRLFQAIDGVPVIGNIAYRSRVRKLARQLESYGHADFVTDASKYTPSA
ncbi:oxygenase MpaB family protein [Pseudopontixanthobacter vadosimaris]|uniref:oxygenase MpaB family protein n=1 Tax=Pseudopontixanthobacter vadosimaris TaxID=2726450 RepID=UPI00197B3A55|nr:oxygenase MpaB family protein [Pseudopontixanthobacter vadosimaris]